MDLTEHLYSVRIVSAVPKFADSLIALLPRDRYAPVTVVPDAAEARRSMLENPAGIVVIHTPLPDEFGNRLALDLCRSGGAGAVNLQRYAAKLAGKVRDHARNRAEESEDTAGGAGADASDHDPV